MRDSHRISHRIKGNKGIKRTVSYFGHRSQDEPRHLFLIASGHQPRSGRAPRATLEAGSACRPHRESKSPSQEENCTMEKVNQNQWFGILDRESRILPPRQNLSFPLIAGHASLFAAATADCACTWRGRYAAFRRWPSGSLDCPKIKLPNKPNFSQTPWNQWLGSQPIEPHGARVGSVPAPTLPVTITAQRLANPVAQALSLPSRDSSRLRSASPSPGPWEAIGYSSTSRTRQGVSFLPR